MEGNYILIGKTPVLITRPELWSKCKTEADYFRTLKEQQKKIKPNPEPIFFIKDSQPGIVPGGL